MRFNEDFDDLSQRRIVYHFKSEPPNEASEIDITSCAWFSSYGGTFDLVLGCDDGSISFSNTNEIYGVYEGWIPSSNDEELYGTDHSKSRISQPIHFLQFVPGRHGEVIFSQGRGRDILYGVLPINNDDANEYYYCSMEKGIIASLTGHESQVKCAVIESSGTFLISGDEEGILIVHQLQYAISNDNLTRLDKSADYYTRTLQAHNGPILSILPFHTDDENSTVKFVTGGFGGFIIVWEILGGENWDVFPVRRVVTGGLVVSSLSTSRDILMAGTAKGAVLAFEWAKMRNQAESTQDMDDEVITNKASDMSIIFVVDDSLHPIVSVACSHSQYIAVIADAAGVVRMYRPENPTIASSLWNNIAELQLGSYPSGCLFSPYPGPEHEELVICGANGLLHRFLTTALPYKRINQIMDHDDFDESSSLNSRSEKSDNFQNQQEIIDHALGNQLDIDDDAMHTSSSMSLQENLLQKNIPSSTILVHNGSEFHTDTAQTELLNGQSWNLSHSLDFNRSESTGMDEVDDHAFLHTHRYSTLQHSQSKFSNDSQDEDLDVHDSNFETVPLPVDTKKKDSNFRNSTRKVRFSNIEDFQEIPKHINEYIKDSLQIELESQSSDLMDSEKSVAGIRVVPKPTVVPNRPAIPKRNKKHCAKIESSQVDEKGCTKVESEFAIPRLNSSLKLQAELGTELEQPLDHKEIGKELRKRGILGAIRREAATKSVNLSPMTTLFRGLEPVKLSPKPAQRNTYHGSTTRHRDMYQHPLEVLSDLSYKSMEDIGDVLSIDWLKEIESEVSSLMYESSHHESLDTDLPKSNSSIFDLGATTRYDATERRKREIGLSTWSTQRVLGFEIDDW